MEGAESPVMAKVGSIMIALLCGSACVVTVEGEEIVTDDRTLSDDAHDVEGRAPAPEGDFCDLLPDCGPCSLACDFDALVEHVPPCTCAAFVCVLTDGRRVSFHACHPDE